MAGIDVKTAARGAADRFGAPFNPESALRARNRKRRRGAFFTCLLAGLLLMLVAMGASVAVNALRADLLKAGVDRYVVARGLLSQSDADAFVLDTIFYLNGASDVWEPSVTVAGLRLAVPDTFRDHMAEVKGWVESAKGILIGMGAVALLLLGRAVMSGRSGKHPFSAGGYYLGAGLPLLLALGAGLWAYLDFDSLWMWLHRLLIPDGIFPAGEQIMQLFPVSLFGGYLRPVAVMFALCAGAVLLLPLPLTALSRRRSAKVGKGAGENHTRAGSAGRWAAARKTTKNAAGKNTRRAAD